MPRIASGSGYAYFCVLTGVFITALYTFRMFFMTFLGKERMDHHTQEHLHESPWVVTCRWSFSRFLRRSSAGSPSRPMLFGRYFEGSIHVLPPTMYWRTVGEEFHGPASFVLSAFLRLPYGWPAWAYSTAWLFFLWRPALADAAEAKFKWLLHHTDQ